MHALKPPSGPWAQTPSQNRLWFSNANFSKLYHEAEAVGSLRHGVDRSQVVFQKGLVNRYASERSHIFSAAEKED